MRPRRLYKDKNRYYYLVNGKRKFIRIPSGISQKQVVKINIKNVSDTGRRIKKRKKRKIVKYTTDKVAPDMLRSFKPATTQLPITLYSLQRERDKTKGLKIEDVGSEDLKKATLAIGDLIKTLSKAPKIEAQPKLALPDVAEITDFSETPEQFLGGLSEYPTQIPTKKRLPIEDSKEVKDKAERMLEKIKSKTTTPASSVVATPLREEEEEEKFPSAVSTIYELPSTLPTKYLPTQLKQLLGRNLVAEERDYKNSPIIRKSLNRSIKEKNPDINITEFSNFKNWKKEIEDQYQISLRLKAGKGSSKEDGLWNDEIEKILKLKIKDTVPFVNNQTKRFGFIMNTADSSSDGSGENGNSLGHWVSTYINNEDDYPSIEYFDSFGDDPKESTIQSLKQMACRINREKYFKFKINKLKLQPEKSPHCGHYAIKFLEDRFNGIPFSEASGYDAYIERFKPDFSKDFKVRKYDNYL
jgi:hypothetical protein